MTQTIGLVRLNKWGASCKFKNSKSHQIASMDHIIEQELKYYMQSNDIYPSTKKFRGYLDPL